MMRFARPDRCQDRVWGRTVVEGGLANWQGSRIGGPGEISPDYPLAVWLHSTNESQGQSVHLEFRSLKLGEVVRSIDLWQPRNDMQRPWEIELPHLMLAADKALVIQENRLSVYPFPAELRKGLALPLMLKYPKIGVASVEKPLAIQLVATGGEGEVSYKLTGENEGLAVNANGKLALDLPLLWKKIPGAAEESGQGPAR